MYLIRNKPHLKVCLQVKKPLHLALVKKTQSNLHNNEIGNHTNYINLFLKLVVKATVTNTVTIVKSSLSECAMMLGSFADTASF